MEKLVEGFIEPVIKEMLHKALPGAEIKINSIKFTPKGKVNGKV